MSSVTVDAKIHASFAWLGHGSIIRRSQAVEFLALMAHLEVSDDEMKMADNYFTILSNTFAEIWFDQGLELGGGQPFTVGSEGDIRNNRHIVRPVPFVSRNFAQSHSRGADSGCTVPGFHPNLCRYR